MGKIRTRTLGLEEEEKKQKKEQKLKSQEKALSARKKTEATKGQEKNDEREEKIENKADVKKKSGKKKISETSVKQAQTRGTASAKTLAKRGKKYKQVKEKLVKDKIYSVDEAVVFLKKNKYAKFDESVEVHLNVDKTGLKGEVEFPFTTGKSVKVAVVSDELLSEIEKGNVNFDILVTHPSYMPKLAKFAKLLGPKGLMPNPKAGTISPNPEELVKKFSKGVSRWKTEPKFSLIHQMVGKISAEEKELDENIKTFLKSVGKSHILGAFVKTTMSPALKLNIEQI